jgi:hypothetical protein
MLHIRLQQLFLVENFQGNNEFGFLLAGKVDMTEFSTAQGFPDLEIINCPIFRLKLLALQNFHLILCCGLSLISFFFLLRIIVLVYHLYLLLLLLNWNLLRV